MACSCAMAARFASGCSRMPTKRGQGGAVRGDPRPAAERGANARRGRAWVDEPRTGDPYSWHSPFNGPVRRSSRPGRLRLFETSKCSLRNASRAILTGCTCNMQYVHIEITIHQTWPNRRIASFVSILAGRCEGRDDDDGHGYSVGHGGYFRMDLYMFQIVSSAKHCRNTREARSVHMAAFWILTPVRR